MGWKKCTMRIPRLVFSCWWGLPLHPFTRCSCGTPHSKNWRSADVSKLGKWTAIRTWNQFTFRGSATRTGSPRICGPSLIRSKRFWCSSSIERRSRKWSLSFFFARVSKNDDSCRCNWEWTSWIAAGVRTSSMIGGWTTLKFQSPQRPPSLNRTTFRSGTVSPWHRARQWTSRRR